MCIVLKVCETLLHCVNSYVLAGGGKFADVYLMAIQVL